MTMAAVAVAVTVADVRPAGQSVAGRSDAGLRHGAFEQRSAYAAAAPSLGAPETLGPQGSSDPRTGPAVMHGHGLWHGPAHGAAAFDAASPTPPASATSSANPPSVNPSSATASANAFAGRLTREQGNVVRFIAQRYSIAVGSAQHFVQEAYHAARDARIDPLLVLAVMSIESSFDPRAQSSQGAKGLMQVLARVHVDKFEPFGGAKAVFDPMANIRVGTGILRDYLARTGSVHAALKWYVGAALMNDDGGYGAKVLHERERIAAVAAGRPLPPDPAPMRMTVSTRAVPAAQVRKAESDAREDPKAQSPAARDVPLDEPALLLLTPGAPRDPRAETDSASPPVRYVESGKSLADGI